MAWIVHKYLLLKDIEFLHMSIVFEGTLRNLFWTIDAENYKERKQITDLKDIQKVILDLIFRFKSVKML